MRSMLEKCLGSYFRAVTSAVVLCCCLQAGQTSWGQSIELPMPGTATNAALHYQRACLLLSSVDYDQRKVLEKPIWEIITADTSDEDIAQLDQLLVASRHAIRSALVGADQLEADFGLDVRQYVVASYLPHAQLMKDLGRLVALHGMQQQSAGEWRTAAETYLAGLRMGQHMTHQPTLAEAAAGVEILESMYFALGHWAERCPDTELVDEVLTIVNAMAVDMVNPARTMNFEASISQMRLDALEQAFPDGPWAEMVLEALGAEMPSAGPDGMREAAIEAVVKLGVPREAFDNKQSFGDYMRKLRTVYAELARESANCLTLDAPRSIEQGEAIYAKYDSKLPPTERATALNPAKLAAFFAVHQAELDILRQVLAISAARSDGKFPASLDEVRSRLGGELPTSPYDGSQYQYETLEDGRGFSLGLAKATVGGIDLPAIKFQYTAPDGQ